MMWNTKSKCSFVFNYYAIWYLSPSDWCALSILGPFLVMVSVFIGAALHKSDFVLSFPSFWDLENPYVVPSVSVLEILTLCWEDIVVNQVLQHPLVSHDCVFNCASSLYLSTLFLLSVICSFLSVTACPVAKKHVSLVILVLVFMA